MKRIHLGGSSFASLSTIFQFDHPTLKRWLLLYEKEVDVSRPFISFLENGLKSDHYCLYAYDRTSHSEPSLRRFLDSYSMLEKIHLFPLSHNVADDVYSLFLKISKVQDSIFRDNRYMKLIMDFGALITDRVDLVTDIIEKILATIHGKRVAEGDEKLGSDSITALHLDSLSGRELNKLAAFYNNVIITTKSESALSVSIGELESIDDIVKAIPRRPLMEFVKRHLEPVTLSLFMEKAMCGYDVIRIIYDQYHTYVSPGTLYPLLYSLSDRGVLGVQPSIEGGVRSRARVTYFLTERGRVLASKNLEDFLIALKFLHKNIQTKLTRGGEVEGGPNHAAII